MENVKTIRTTNGHTYTATYRVPGLGSFLADGPHWIVDGIPGSFGSLRDALEAIAIDSVARKQIEGL